MALPLPLPVTPIRVVIVDSDDRVRGSLAGIFGTSERVDVLGDAGDPVLALALIARTRPDAVVLDPRLPDVDGAVGFIEAVRAAVPSVCILAMSWSGPLEHAALAAGADGFVRKTYRSSELVAALLAAMADCSRP